VLEFDQDSTFLSVVERLATSLAAALAAMSGVDVAAGTKGATWLAIRSPLLVHA